MTENQQPSGLLRSIAIILMALTVLFTLMGGIGTTCVAFGAEKYESMKGLVPFKPLYQILVIISIAAGIWGTVILVNLVRGGAKLYRNTLIMLGIGTLTSGIQTAISQSVRGSSAPVNFRFGITAFTLIVFLLFRLPPIWSRMRFDQSLGKSAKDQAAGTALIVCGGIALSTYWWTASTHLASWIDVIRIPLLVVGWALVSAGIVHFIRPLFTSNKQDLQTQHTRLNIPRDNPGSD